MRIEVCGYSGKSLACETASEEWNLCENAESKAQD